ncbi:hypothetical protein SCHPADRAFT_948203 [Schizopora paradoxa]|uniref:Uncharacterized protein n=1 Tax=Schizopora paradoxa TaxID=27342 RepID=A0A0H2QX68_9AGAM|nr:hypothetical protein SCHPADRAFT_948203 [Schizopora paradoxa]
MHAVDSYEQDCLDDVGRQHQGNSSYKRVFISKNADKRRYMSGLPRNFYDDVWYKELDEAEKSLVNAEDRFVNIPKLTPYVRQSST